MVLFGAEIEYNDEAKEFVNITKLRLSDPKIGNLFRDHNIGVYNSVLIIELISIFPQIVFYGLGVIGLSLALVFNIITFGVIGGFCAILGFVLYSPKFYFLVFKKGLKKTGYKGVNNFLSHEQIVKRCLL